MWRKILVGIVGVTLSICAGALHAQSPEGWQALRQQIRDTRSYRLGVPTQLQALGNSQTVIFHRSLPPSNALELFELDLATGKESKLLDAAMLASGGGTMSDQEKALRERLRLQTGGINFSLPDPKGERILIPVNGKLFLYTRKTKQIKEITKGDGPIFSPKISPDGQWVAYVRRSNVFIARLDGGIEQALTRGGSEALSYGVAEFIAQEELDRRDGLWWSPDSRTLMIEEVDQRGVERLVISDPSKPSDEPQRSYYPRPGRKNAATRFGFISILGGDPRWIHFGKSDVEYVAGVNWDQDKPTLQLFDREQKRARLVKADPLSLKTETLLEEQDAAWVDMDSHLPQWLSDGKSFLWISEKSGAKVLELRDGKGNLTRQLTQPGFGLQQWVGLDRKRQKALVLASSKPESSILYEIDIADGSSRVIQEEGQIAAQVLPKSDFFVVRSSHLQGEEKIVLRSFDQRLERTLRSLGPTPLAKAQVAIEQVGSDQMRVSIVRPRGFDPQQKYPVVENAYGGPGSQMVRSSGTAYLSDQVLADALGAILVRIDSRGTPGRGRDWERAIAGKFGSLPVEEHAATLKELFARFPEMDAQRVGVFGWSYGGYFAAYAALARPDVYKAAVVGAPPVDWLDYDTAYTERYLGLPDRNKEAYERASLLHLLETRKNERDQKPSPILLIHGSADDNVYFFHSLKFVDALERKGYPYEFLPLIGMTHMVSDPALDDRRFYRTLDFLRRNLAGGPALSQ